jgi:hypothetical protein
VQEPDFISKFGDACKGVKRTVQKFVALAKRKGTPPAPRTPTVI